MAPPAGGDGAPGKGSPGVAIPGADGPDPLLKEREGLQKGPVRWSVGPLKSGET